MMPVYADVDAAYGRLNGDVAIAASAGVAAGPSNRDSGLGPRFDGDLRLRYLQTAGLFGTVNITRWRKGFFDFKAL